MQVKLVGDVAGFYRDDGEFVFSDFRVLNIYNCLVSCGIGLDTSVSVFNFDSFAHGLEVSLNMLGLRIDRTGIVRFGALIPYDYRG